MTITTEPWKWGQRQMTPASWPCTPTPNSPSIHRIYTRPIAYSIWDIDLTTKLNLVHWSVKWGRGQVKLSWWAWGTCKDVHIPNKVILLLIREKLTLQKFWTYFQVVTEPWKWDQEQWTCDITHLYTKYEASKSFTF